MLSNICPRLRSKFDQSINQLINQSKQLKKYQINQSINQINQITNNIVKQSIKITKLNNQSINQSKSIHPSIHQITECFIILIIISDVSVHCEYIELADHINVSTYIYSVEKFEKTNYNRLYWVPSDSTFGNYFNDDIVHYRYRQNGAALFVSQRDNNTCSQHVKTSCYFDGFNRVYNPRFEL